ncbi:MAG: universal stress protein [Gemmatimonadota bacterium]
MELSRVVVATDASDAGRAAIEAGRAVAAGSGAGLTVMTAALKSAAAIAAGSGSWDQGIESVEALARHLRAVLGTDAIPPEIELDVAIGLPGIEVPRYAEAHAASLIVLGRKPRSHAARLVMGDTADAVARRSRVPCLIVPPGGTRFGRILVALDGTVRGEIVFDTACAFARALGASLGVVTIGPQHDGEPEALAAEVPGARAERIARTARELGERCGLSVEVIVRRGEPVTEIMAASAGWDVLVVGYHRGGPPGIIEGGSVARRLAHLVPGALMTVPL